MSKTIIYARKSTESEDRQVLSIDSQVKELRDLASRRGLTVEHVFTESKSAKAPGRPVFNKMMNHIRRGQATAILCWKLDRLARNPVDGGAVIWAMEEGSLQHIHSPQNSFGSTGNDKFWMQMEFGMASKFIYDLRDNTKRGLRAKLEQGWYPCRAPLGYMNDPLTRTIVKDPDRFALVRRLWDFALTGAYSPSAIRDMSESEWGITTRPTRRQGGRSLSLSAVYKILHNPFYYGMILYNGETYQGSHKPMITKAEFEQIQRMLGSDQKSKPIKRHFAFTGLIRCGECDGAITATHTVNRHGVHYEYYHCTKNKRHVSCSQPAIRREELELQFATIMESITLPKSYAEWVLQILRSTYDEEKIKDRLSLAQLRRRHESIKRELSSLIDMKLRSLLSEQEYKEKKSQLVNEQISIAEILNDRDKYFHEVFHKTEQVINLVEGLKGKFINGDDKQKRELVVTTCSNPTLFGRKLRIQVRKPFSYVEQGITRVASTNPQFKPEKHRQGKRTIQISQPSIVLWGGLVKDLQTYFAQHNNASPISNCSVHRK